MGAGANSGRHSRKAVVPVASIVGTRWTILQNLSYRPCHCEE